jgi:hypothetical protein
VAPPVSSWVGQSDWSEEKAREAAKEQIRKACDVLPPFQIISRFNFFDTSILLYI